jgi:hypothetical protein
MYGIVFGRIVLVFAAIANIYVALMFFREAPGPFFSLLTQSFMFLMTAGALMGVIGLVPKTARWFKFPILAMLLAQAVVTFPALLIGGLLIGAGAGDMGSSGAAFTLAAIPLAALVLLTAALISVWRIGRDIPTSFKQTGVGFILTAAIFVIAYAFLKIFIHFAW